MLALIVWTFVIWFWLYATACRRCARRRHRPGPHQAQGRPRPLPGLVQQIADNYNHLHEQPTVFYALAVYSHLAGVADPLNVGLAWGYVACASSIR